MKRIVALALALLLVLAGCGRQGQDTPDAFMPEDTEAPSQAPEQVDYLAIMRRELFNRDTPLNAAMAEVVELTLDSVGEGSITVTVTAPDVCEGTLAWFEAVSEEDYSDEALDQQMMTLLEGERQTRQFVLEVQAETIVYTDEFLDAASCGVRQFYTALTVMLMEEMEASVDG